jgi:hypothetical protein
MKTSFKAFTYGLSTLLAVGLVFISSCSKDKDDPEPEVATLSFEVSEMTVNEADGEIEIKLVLDRPAPEDFKVEYELDGNMRDPENADANGRYDFEILADEVGEVEFEKGDESATITIALIQDPYLEGYTDENTCIPEVLNISIEDVNSDLIDISNDDEIDISVEQEDGMIAMLVWGPTEEGADPYTDVDMDLLLWMEIGGELQPTDFLGAVGSFQAPELRFVPFLGDGNYGFSYNYYEGSVEPMEWAIVFADVVNGAIEDEDDQVIYEGAYSLANRNKWLETDEFVLAQTFEIDGNEFQNFSDVTIEETGSRVRTRFHNDIKRVSPSDIPTISDKYIRRK